MSPPPSEYNYTRLPPSSDNPNAASRSATEQFLEYHRRGEYRRPDEQVQRHPTQQPTPDTPYQQRIPHNLPSAVYPHARDSMNDRARSPRDHPRGRSVDTAFRDANDHAWHPRRHHLPPPPSHLPSPQDAYYSSHQTTYADASFQHTPPYPVPPHATLASPFSHSHSPRIATFDIPTAPTPAQLEAGRLENWQRNFADGLFEGIDTPLDAPNAYTTWPKDSADDDDKLLVLLRCAARIGFTSLPKAFAAYLINQPHKHDKISRSISQFFHPREGRATTSALEIVQLLTAHESARMGSDRRVVPIAIQVPQYAKPPSARLLTPEPGPPLSQRNAIAQWAFDIMIAAVDNEADTLLGAGSEFLRGTSVLETSWDLLRTFSMTEAQQTIATHAPLTFAVTSTIATSKKARRRVDAVVAAMAAADAQSSEDTSSSDEEQDEGDESISSPPCDSRPTDEPSTLEPEPSAKRMKSAPAPGVPKGSQSDPWLGCTVAVLLLLRFRNKYAIVFAIMMAIFCFSCRAHKDLIAILCHVGLTTSYSSIHRLLERLARDKLKHLRVLASRAMTLAPPFSVIYDNINKMRRAYQSTATNHDEMYCGTAASIVELVEVEEGSLDESLKAQPLLDNIDADKRASLTSQMLLDDIDGEHMEGVVTAQILRQWTQVIPSLARFATEVDKLFKEKHAKRPSKIPFSVKLRAHRYKAYISRCSIRRSANAFLPPESRIL